MRTLENKLIFIFITEDQFVNSRLLIQVMQVNSRSVFFFENCAGSLDFYAMNSNEIDAIVKKFVPILWPYVLFYC